MKKRMLKRAFASAMAALMVSGTAAALPVTLTPVVHAAIAVVDENVLTNTSALSAETIVKGQSVKVRCAASGGAGDYQYAVYFRHGQESNWIIAQKYSTNAVVTIRPQYAAEYEICVRAKDAAGKIEKKYLNLQVNKTLQNTSTMSTTEALKGQPVTVNCSAEDGTGSYQYAVYYKQASKNSWTLAQKFSTNDQVNITPKAAVDYQICVHAKDGTGKVSKKYLQISVKAPLVNSSRMSKSTILKGDSVTLKGAAKGGAGGYTYAFYYKRSSNTGYSCAQAFSEATTVAITPTAAVDYDVCIKVKDAEGKIESKYLTLRVLPAIKNTSRISKASVTKGESVTLTGAATGGSEGFTYAYYYKRRTQTKWTLGKAYSDSTSIEIKPLAAVSYDVRINAKDSMGHVDKKDFVLQVYPALKNNSSISAGNIFKGESVTVKGAASGGNGSYQYAYYYKRATNENWTLAKAYSSDTSVEITPTAAVDYDVRVRVKDGEGNVTEKDFTLQVVPVLVNNSSVKKTTILKGQSVALVGDAKGGSGGYQYAYYYKRTSQKTWSTVQKYSEAASATLEPMGATDYDIMIRVKDSMGHVSEKFFSLTVLPALENQCVLSSETIEKGQAVTVTSTGKGGSGDLQYAFYYKRAENTGWTCAQEYGTNNKADITPMSSGSYDIRVKVKDSMGNVAVSDMSVKVVAVLKNTSTVDKTSLTVGETVTLTGGATGGSEEYKYGYLYKRTGDKSWSLLKGYTVNNTWTFTPTEAGTYELSVKVKDSLENVVEKTFALNVTEELANLSTIDATEIVKGETVTLTGAASGGSEGYTYAYYYKQKTQETWTNAKSYSTSTTAVITPRAVVAYDVRVDVKDKSGKVVSKYFEVEVRQPLQNNTQLNSGRLVAGQTLVIYGQAEGGIGGYEFEYSYEKDGESESHMIKEFSSDTTAEQVMTEVGSYNILVRLRDSTGHTADMGLGLQVTEGLSNTSSIDKTMVAPGQSVTVTGAATGGSQDYEFAFYYKKADENDWTLAQDYGDRTTAQLAFDEAGSYDVLVKAKDSLNTVAEAAFTVQVTAAPVNTSTLDKTSIVKGDSVTIMGSAQGGSGGYTYAYAYKQTQQDNWTIIKNFSTDTTAVIRPARDTEYVVRVTVRDSLGSETEKLLYVTVLSALTNESTVSASSILKGETVILNGAANGGAGEYTYGYYYREATVSDWIPIPVVPTPGVPFTPTSTGSYELRIAVTDASGETVNKDFTLTVNNAFTNESTISATEVTVGQRVVITAAARGQSASYTYAFYTRAAGDNEWVTYQDFGSNSMITIPYSSVGTYEWLVSIKDNLGNVESKSFSVNVLAALSNSSTVNKTSCKLGESIELKASAKGGSGTYTYAYFYKKGSENYWSVLKNNSDDKSAVFTPNETGEFDLRVTITDSMGNVKTKDFRVTVNEGFVNTSTVNKTFAVTGDTVLLTASATGGTKPYSYAFHYKGASQTNWTTLKDYSTTSSMKITLSSPTDFNFRILVKDASGDVVEKTMNVIVRDQQIVNTSYLESETVKLGTDAVLVNTYEGGIGTVKFAGYYRLAGNSGWTTISSGSTASTLSFRPNAAGTYEVRSVVTDAQGNSAETFISLNIVEALFEEKLDSILNSILTPNMDDFEKLKAIHDWMVNYAEYDSEGYSTGNIPETSYSAEGFIDTRKAVCDGYAKVFAALAERVGFEVIRVTGVGFNGTGTESHAWNQVKLNGNWYNVDVTWDDPVVIGTSSGNNISYKYFLVPDNGFIDNHYAESFANTCTTAQPVERLVTIEKEKDLAEHPDYAFCTSESEMKSAMANFYENGTMTFTLIYQTSDTNKSNIMNTVAAQRPDGTGMSISIVEWKFSGYYKIGVTLT